MKAVTMPWMVLGVAGLLSARTEAALIVPYTADAHTIALFHFDEAAGAADPGNPIVNYGSGGAALDLTNTGGPDGRNNTGGGGYGAAAFAGLGTAFDVRNSGDGTYHTGTGGSATGGGLMTGAGVLQSSLQGASGAFTLEALVQLVNSTSEQEILAHDGSTTRGFLFRVINGGLSLYTGTATVTNALPAAGEHAFAAGAWFHAAVTYSGDEGVADNVRFYWTALDSAATAANLIGTATLAADLSGSVGNSFGVGTTTRSPFRFEAGAVDEVRISSVARGADDFLIVVPEPASCGLLALGGAIVLLRRRRA